MAGFVQLSSAEIEKIRQVLKNQNIRFRSVWDVKRYILGLWGETDELDLADLEKIIESVGEPRSAAVADDVAEDLDLDLDLDTEAGAQTAQAGNGLDFPDLEQMLETDDTQIADAVDDDVELIFDIDDTDLIDEYPVKEIEKVWLFELSVNFIKSIKKTDKKLKGRILDAIEAISSKPDERIGNTIKPLSKELKGLWRYRIGDYRLIYRPDYEKGVVTLITFDPRGGAY